MQLSRLSTSNSGLCYNDSDSVHTQEGRRFDRVAIKRKPCDRLGCVIIIRNLLKVVILHGNRERPHRLEDLDGIRHLPG